MTSKLPECKKGFIHHDLCSCRNDLIAERDQLKLRAEALDAKCDAQAKEIEWLKKFEGWDQNRIDEIASDRDSWKARAERMEKAIKLASKVFVWIRAHDKTPTYGVIGDTEKMTPKELANVYGPQIEAALTETEGK